MYVHFYLLNAPECDFGLCIRTCEQAINLFFQLHHIQHYTGQVAILQNLFFSVTDAAAEVVQNVAAASVTEKTSFASLTPACQGDNQPAPGAQHHLRQRRPRLGAATVATSAGATSQRPHQGLEHVPGVHVFVISSSMKKS